MIKLNLKHYRNKLKLTQNDLAIKANLNQTYVSRLENNNFRYKTNERDKFIAICKALKVCPSQVIVHDCNNCVIRTTQHERKLCRDKHIKKGCKHLFLLDE